MNPIAVLAKAGRVYAAKRMWKALRLGRRRKHICGVGEMYLEPGDFIGSRLYFFGIWEPSISAFMRDRVSAGSVAIDIGANIGYYSLLLANAVGPAGRVYAIEPAAPIIEKLRANIALNQLTNVEVIPFGISDKPERRAFVLEAQNLGASHFGEVSQSGVQLVRLESVIDPADLSRVSMIKVDVEGFEAVVLREILTLVHEVGSRLTVIGEIRDTPETQALFQDFRRAGFSTFALNNEYRLPNYVEWKVAPPRQVNELPPGQTDIAFVRR